MFWRKQLRENDKKILGETNIDDGAQVEPGVINVKATCKEQLFSSYSYSGDMLNTEFSEYVFDKAKSVPIKERIKIRIHTDDEINADDVAQAMKSHYRAVYKETKKEVKRVTAISLIMTLLGIIALTVLILINHFTENLYITSIVEIAAWVFIWEAVDYFFLQRPVIKGKCILIQRIYDSEIEVTKTAQPTAQI